MEDVHPQLTTNILKYLLNKNHVKASKAMDDNNIGSS